MRVVYPAAFLAMIVEGAMRPDVSTLWPAGALLFAAAKALKYWAIASLGPCWTFRVIVVPGMTRVADGPYRYLRHPNYVAVGRDVGGGALLTGARLAGPIGTALFVALIVRRVAVENRALDAILPRG